MIPEPVLTLDAAGVARRLGAARPLSDGGWTCRCPAHRDAHPSLTVHLADDGKMLVRCHAGCAQPRVIHALRARGLWPAARSAPSHPATNPDARPRPRPDSWRPIIPVPADAPAPHFAIAKYGAPTAHWAYRNINSELIGYIYRFDPPGGKQILPLTFCHSSGGAKAWRWQSFPKPRPLYNLDRLATNPDAPVIVVEGEKCATALAAAMPECVVTTWPGGAKAVATADWSPLRGRTVTIWPDNDAPGAAAANVIARILASPNNR